MSKKDFLNDLTELCNNNVTFIPGKEEKKNTNNKEEKQQPEQEEVKVSKPNKTSKKSIKAVEEPSKPEEKKKKKNKKKSLVDDFHFYDDKFNIVSGEDLELDDDDPDSTMLANGRTIADMIQYQLENMDEAFSDDIILTERKRYKQKGSDNFEDDFSQVLALLYDNLKKSEQLDRDLDKLVKPALTSRTRQMSKYVVDLVGAKISNNGNSLSIIKEIAATRKKIADLRMNEAKNSKQADFGENNPELIAGAFFDRIASMGRNNFMDTVNRPGALENINDVEYESIAGYNDNYIGDDDDNVPDFDIESVLAERETGRTEADELRIKYEKLNPKVVIIRDLEEGTWEFAALDKDGNTIEDYPVPDKKLVGRVSFSYDGSSASDEQGKTYKVYEYEMDDSDGDDENYYEDESYDESDE